ncbi:phosphate transporter [Burkholderia pseudomultivorans]|uniref:phosphate transporter n=1 Tax=Burkholderia pseudomultivorans TaxID=1207504 RepID=UPI0028746C68|nr:phosphate transporter [Burkholderia pseudomultivorans]MDS0791078.1 phosphate transporter [Burkholderia pseudomultivorans]
MPNFAATEASGALSRRMHTIGLALFCPVAARGIVDIATRFRAGLGPLKARSALPFLLLVVALPIARDRALHRAF